MTSTPTENPQDSAPPAVRPEAGAGPEPDPMLGQLVDGRYQVRERIARGGMATVYLAHDQRLGRDVALKVMHPHLADGESGAQFTARFQREARAAARLAHPSTVAVYDQGVDAGLNYLTMEYVPGTDLRSELHRQGTFSVGDTLDVLEQVLAALAAAHENGLVHRDIKPENVLIDNAGRIKVADFGLAKAVTDTGNTMTAPGNVIGTVAYLAPEVISTGNSDPRSDIYAVGILGYEMITGSLPHGAASPFQLAFQHVHEDVPAITCAGDWLPDELSDLLQNFSARDPQQRPADGVAALQQWRSLRKELEASDPLLLAQRVEPPARTAAGPAPTTSSMGGALATAVVEDDAPDDGATVVLNGGDGRLAQATVALTQQPTRLYAEADLSGGAEVVEARPDATVLMPVPPPPTPQTIAPRPLEENLTPAVVPARPSRLRGAFIATLVAIALLALGGWLLARARSAGPDVVVATDEPTVEEVVTTEPEPPVTTPEETTPEPTPEETTETEDVQPTQDPDGLATIPDRIIGVDVGEAFNRLGALGLVAVVNEGDKEYSDTIPADAVIGSIPSPGTQVPTGTTVELIISRGPAS